MLHTILIWVLYVAMFAVGFWCLPATAEVPWAGIPGFVAGAIGIVLVQGGIGVYPRLRGLDRERVHGPAGGWRTAQARGAGHGLAHLGGTDLMVIVLGGLSLLLISRSKASTA